MAQIYDSRHSGQEVDNAVDAVQTTIPNQLTQIGLKLIKLSGWSTSRNEAMPNIGDYGYIVGSNKVYKRYGAGYGQVEEIPYYDGALYTYKNEIFVWNGTELVESTLRYKELIPQWNLSASLDTFIITNIIGTSSLTYRQSDGDKSIILPVKEGDVINIRTGSKSTRLGFCASFPTLGDSALENYYLSANATITKIAPSNAKYVIINTTSVNTFEDVAPIGLSINDYDFKSNVNEHIAELESSVTEIDDKPTAGSDNLVKSGGVESYISAKIEKQESLNTLFALVDSKGRVILSIDSNLKLHAKDDFLDNILNDKLLLKVNVADIIDNLTTQNAEKPLSANQGYALKSLIDGLNERLSEIEATYKFVTSKNYIIAIVDADDKVLWGIKKNGNLYEPTRYKESKKWLFAITDDNDKVVFGIEKDSTIYAPGFKVTQYDKQVAEIEESISDIKSDVKNIQEEIQSISNRVSTESCEIANGKTKAHGTYISELACSPLVDDSAHFNVAYKTVSKSENKDYNTNIVAFNHDDGELVDVEAIRKIYNKYGFHGSSCAIFRPFATLNSAKSFIINYRKWLAEGHSFGLHAIMAASYWIGDRLQDIRPDGSTTFGPKVNEIRGSEADGTGTNTFGNVITTDTLIKNIYTSSGIYASPNFNKKVVEITQEELDEINSLYSFYGDVYTISGIDDLAIPDILNADSAETVSKTRIGWLEYYYNGLIDNTLGYSSTANNLADKFAEDYSVPEGSTVEDYYPDADHLVSGKMVYWGDTANSHFAEAILKTDANFTSESYQLVGKFTKGLYKNCYSTCNYEVINRCLEVATAFFRYYFNMHHFTDCHLHGVGYNYFRWKGEDGVYYLDRNENIVDSYNQRYYFSNVGAFCTIDDIFSEYNIDFVKETIRRLWANIEGQIGNYYGQGNIKQVYGSVGGNIQGDGYDYTDFLALFGTTDTGMETMSFSTFSSFTENLNEWFKYFYENGGQTVERNGISMKIYRYLQYMINAINHSIGTGKIPVISVDTLRNSPAIIMAMELIFRYCKDNGYEVVSLDGMRNKIKSTFRNMGGNLIPNPGFKQPLLKYLGGSSNTKEARVPEGWRIWDMGIQVDVSDDITDGVKRHCAVISSSGHFKTKIYGLSSGKYRLSYDCLSSSNSTHFQIFLKKNKDKYEVLEKVGNEYTYTSQPIDDYVVSTNNIWETHSFEFEIAPFVRNDADGTPVNTICGGYEDNVCAVEFIVYNNGASTKLANVSLKCI